MFQNMHVNDETVLELFYQGCMFTS